MSTVCNEPDIYSGTKFPVLQIKPGLSSVALRNWSMLCVALNLRD